MTDLQRVEITAAELVDGDVIVDKAGTEWPVVTARDPEPGTVAFWIGSPPVHLITKTPTDPVTVLRATPPPEWATEPVNLDPDDGAISNPDEPGDEPPHVTEAKRQAEERLVQEKLGGTVAAVEDKAHEEARTAATVTGVPMTLPTFDDFTILEKRSHLFLLHGVYAEDVKSDGDLVVMHHDLHETAEKPGRWVAHEHVAGAAFPGGTA